MPDRLMCARLYRERAEELRTICESWSDGETMRKLAIVASDYDRMAEHLERSGKPGETAPPKQ